MNAVRGGAKRWLANLRAGAAQIKVMAGRRGCVRVSAIREGGGPGDVIISAIAGNGASGRTPPATPPAITIAASIALAHPLSFPRGAGAYPGRRRLRGSHAGGQGRFHQPWRRGLRDLHHHHHGQGHRGRCMLSRVVAGVLQDRAEGLTREEGG